MRLNFSHTCPSLRQTMRFEELFESGLQLSQEERINLNERCLDSSAWLYVDGCLAGEQVLVNATDFAPEGVDPWDLPEIIKTAKRRLHTAYVYSTALFPEFRGMGIGLILSTYVLGHLRGYGHYRLLTGHATTSGMCAIRNKLGAVCSSTHEDWFGSGRKAEYYVITI